MFIVFRITKVLMKDKWYINSNKKNKNREILSEALYKNINISWVLILKINLNYTQIN